MDATFSELEFVTYNFDTMAPSCVDQKYKRS